MAQFSVMFWNVANLFEPGAVARGPQSEQELQAKIDRLADVINQLHNGHCPDLMGFCEIGSERIFDELIQRLGRPCLTLWENAGQSTQTGLGLAAAEDVVASLQRVDAQRPTIASRPRCLLATIELAGSSEPVAVAVNHWKSRMIHGGVDPTSDQQETARWLAEQLDALGALSVIAFGDFNAEPFESPFNEVGLRGVRHFSSAIFGNAADTVYLYNTAWRWLAEPDLLEDLHAAGNHVTRPRMSHDASPAVIFDHLLVSRQMLLPSSVIRLREGSVRLHHAPPAGKRLGSGNIKPHRWRWLDINDFEGSSDHFPLAGVFETG